MQAFEKWSAPEWKLWVETLPEDGYNSGWKSRKKYPKKEWKEWVEQMETTKKLLEQMQENKSTASGSIGPDASQPAQGNPAQGDLNRDDPMSAAPGYPAQGEPVAFKLYGSNAAERKKFRGALRKAQKQKQLDSKCSTFKSHLAPPPKICNRVGTGWKEPAQPCECSFWPQWLRENSNTHVAKRTTTVTDALGVAKTVEPGDNILYYRPGKSNTKWWYNGKVKEIWIIQFPNGNRKRIIALN
jgi:hypothetical protein